MKWRYFFLSLLLLSLIANAIFIPRYFNLHSSSRKVTPEILGLVHNANLSLQKYNKTHSSSALDHAVMNLLSASGQLQQYGITANDGIAGKFGLMLGNLGGELVQKRNVQRDSQIVDQIDSQIPSTLLNQGRINQANFDNRVEMILKQFPPAQYHLY
ncbi:hypothetical protein LLE49_27055 [Alicyclobacillus tolerans]|uniref:hypothetical protein n=1 Tax=Alicyclobacillus tolerans TaxID=90970 RepID=UPI001F2ACAED|nr:hypothetical protein [Alicyclobacillus tolerans]MCF8568381.1 hypothetical protein [Alicyclobacillus tolerans]